MKLSTFFLRHHWCHHALARNADGHPCDPKSRGARAWSLHGAMLRVFDHNPTRQEYDRAYWLAVAKVCPTGETGLGAWNDKKGRTKKQVVTLCMRLDI